MAFLPMGSPTDQNPDYLSNRPGYASGVAQETMFGESAPEAMHPDAAWGGHEEEVPALASYAGGADFGADFSAAPSPDPNSTPAGEAAALSYDGSEAPASPASNPYPSEAASHPGSENGFGGAPEPATEPSSPAQQPVNVLTANDFAALEDRVLRAVELLRSERHARVEAEARATALEAQLHSLEAQIQQIEAQTPVLERLVQEVETLRIEREQVRQRVERLLGQLDSLEL